MQPALAVAIDFSPPSEHARRAAVAMARRLDAPIVLLHAVDPDPALHEAAVASEAARRLRPIAEAMRAEGVSVAVEVVHGYAEDAIATAATRLGARLLVVGTHARSAPLRWLLGSVAERTLKSSEVPVLVVSDATQALEAWAAGARPLRITFALESAAVEAPLFEVARLFHRAGGCELTFIHVASRALLAGRMAALLEERLRAQLAPLDARVQLVADGEGPADAIVSFLVERPADLTIVGIHPRFDLDAARAAEVARALLRHRVGPLIGVPLAPDADAEEPTGLDAILAPTDLSELGNRAIARAYAVARRGTITLLYVYPAATANPSPLDADDRADLELQLLALVPPDARVRGVSTQVLIVEGVEPAKIIVETATRLGCGLICLGSHGRSTLGRVVLGSVAEEVIHRFPRAVLVVR